MIGSLPKQIVSPRWLLAGMLLLGASGIQSGRGTLAYFTASASNTGNQFTAGKIVLDAANTGFQSSATPVLKFVSGTTAGTCKNNDNLGSGGTTFNALSGSRPMVPGDTCAATIVVSDSSTTVDVLYNLAIAAASNITASSVDANLNNQLQLSVAQMVSPATATNCAPGATLTDTTKFVAASAPYLGPQTKAVGSGGWAVPTASTAQVPLVGDLALSSTSTALSLTAGTSAMYCLIMALPPGGTTASPLTVYNSGTGANTATVQGGNVSYTFYVNARQKPQTP